jgi:hypothetical protein
MKKITTFLLAISLAGSALAAQAGVSGLDPVLNQVGSVKTLNDNIQELKTQIATSSRSGAASLQPKLDAMYIEYKAELEKQLEIQKDAAIVSALRTELSTLTK